MLVPAHTAVDRIIPSHQWLR